jgi:hypothetical protein
VPLFSFVPLWMQLATPAVWLLATFTPIGKNFTLPLRGDPPSESPSRLHILPHEASKIPILTFRCFCQLLRAGIPLRGWRKDVFFAYKHL